jgi:ankyrin repeat protein
VIKYLISEQNFDLEKCTDKDGNTPLDLACQNEHFEVAWYLIHDQHCSVKLGQSDAQALLEWAHREGVLQHLNSKQLSCIVLEKDDAEAVLLWASKEGHLEVVQHQLREKNSNLECTDSDGRTPVEVACW